MNTDLSKFNKFIIKLVNNTKMIKDEIRKTEIQIKNEK